ncbi:fibroblast growth factor 1b isoform X1 [Triplophysa dalaica]|nr:fibroblast growth factor 1b isoform X1 [Triplophysa dalaica]XP_056586335.1 fibroblast growth factor 1b isoform X1 [Triplophysa dalaica]XP_056586337.1 fibroblast growth factor 1b isoform X1 [Triplophysa dalaica]XP_056586338.1 fibroblast growth factor 1b isoform X1 [Triplophysa dalaica]
MTVGPSQLRPLHPQPRGVFMGTVRPSEAHCTMIEGDIGVFTLGPTMIDQKDPKHLPFQKLYCRNGGYHLRIQPNGTVDASRQDNDVHTILKVKAVKAGVVAIRGHDTGQYIAMDKSGKLYGTGTLNDECYFIEKIEENHYNTYCSQRHQENGDWYMGIKKNGRTKDGSKTHKGQNAIYFLPIPVDGSI